MRDVNTFHVTEIFLLISAFNAEKLFGLPDKKTYQLQGEEIFKQAYNSLIDKGIFTSEGKITKGGAQVIRALEMYYQSSKYVRINNLMFAFMENESNEVIVLVEVEDQKNYRCMVMSKILVLKLLIDRFPFMLREPFPNEKEFLMIELHSPFTQELDEYDSTSNIMNLELFHIEETELDNDNTIKLSIFRNDHQNNINEQEEMNESEISEKISQNMIKTNKLKAASNIENEMNEEHLNNTENDNKIEKKVKIKYQYEQWIVFSKDDKLYMIDPMTNKYYHASQYYFLKLLFEGLEFPYKEVANDGKNS